MARTIRRRLWALRAGWVVVAFVTLGFLAASTPGNALDAPARPMLTLAAVAFLAFGYWLTTRRLTEE